MKIFSCFKYPRYVSTIGTCFEFRGFEGKMSTISENTVLSVKIEASLIAKADYLAKRAGISRQRLCTNLLNTGAQEASENPFIFHVGTLISDYKKKVIKAKLQDTENERLVIVAFKPKDIDLGIIDVLASKWDTTRHDVMKRIIVNGIDGLMNAEALGLLTPMIKARDIVEVFQKLCKKGHDAYKDIEEEEGFSR